MITCLFTFTWLISVIGLLVWLFFSLNLRYILLPKNHMNMNLLIISHSKVCNHWIYFHIFTIIVTCYCWLRAISYQGVRGADRLKPAAGDDNDFESMFSDDKHSNMIWSNRIVEQTWYYEKKICFYSAAVYRMLLVCSHQTNHFTW